MTSTVEPVLIMALNVRRHPVKNRLIYDNFIEIEVDESEYKYIQTGIAETHDINEITHRNLRGFHPGTLKFRFSEIRGRRVLWEQLNAVYWVGY